MAKPYFLWKGAADDTLINKIIAAAEVLPQGEAYIGSGNGDKRTNQEIRISNLSWMHYNDSHKFIYDFLYGKADSINYWHFGFQLHKMESLQFTRYEPGGHYKFHNDVIYKKENEQRKLSVVLSLTDPAEYEGGEFLLNPHGSTAQRFKFGKGDLIAFPSWVPHKVEPVTSGKRITLVSWVSGPKFT